MTRANDADHGDHVRNIYSIWGRHPRLYALQDWLTFMGRHGAIRRRAVEAAGLRPGDRVLEIGCGTGRNLENLIHAVGPTGEVVGIDPSSSMIAAAGQLVARNAWRNVELLNEGTDTMFFPAESFDAIVSVLAFSVIPETERALARCQMFLAPRGLISICDARLFPGKLERINPIVERLYGKGAGWDPLLDIPGHMMSVFGNVCEETFNFGSFFVATSRRQS